eukprot:scaffold122811_cov36-Tisochrysis_lutea.AAC.3
MLGTPKRVGRILASAFENDDGDGTRPGGQAISWLAHSRGPPIPKGLPEVAYASNRQPSVLQFDGYCMHCSLSQCYVVCHIHVTGAHLLTTI